MVQVVQMILTKQMYSSLSVKRSKFVAEASPYTGLRRVRKFFGSIEEITRMPNLIEVQRNSFRIFTGVDPSEVGNAEIFQDETC